MHVGIDASVIVELGEAAVPRVDEHSWLGVEEPLIPDVERLGEQVASAGQPGNGCRRGGQHDECVRVTRLLVRSSRHRRRRWSTSRRWSVPQPAGKPSQRLGCKITIGRSSQ